MAHNKASKSGDMSIHSLIQLLKYFCMMIDDGMVQQIHLPDMLSYVD